MQSTATTTPSPETKPQTQTSSTEPAGSTFLTGAKTEPTPKEGEGKGKPEGTTEPKPETQTGAPEKYTDFKLPEGYDFDPSARTAFETTAKELNLSQDAAQKLINIWSDHAAKTAQAPYDLWANTQREWHNQILSRFGGEDGAQRLNAGINKVIDTVLPPTLQKTFRAALDFTGAGSNPDLLEGLSLMLKPMMEGSPVRGGTPTKEGQTQPSTPSGPIDMAGALYPHLVKNRPT